MRKQNGTRIRPSTRRAPARPEAAHTAPREQPAPELAALPRRTVGDDHPIALIRHNSLPMLVQRELERMILAGDLPAGSPLRET